MSEKNNKVKYNLKNAHYALLTIGEDGAVTYGTPTALPGSVSLSLDANGEPENFYADGIAYYVINNNMGYDGDLELALIPESFRTEVLKEKLDAKGVLIEDADAELAQFALLFEFDGDVRHIRHVMYNCSASRPKIEGKTNEDKKEVQTETLTIKSTPLADGKVKAKTGNTTDAAVYANWYKAVYLPTVDSASLQTVAGEKAVEDTVKTGKTLS
ncbi:major tail protein [Blautia glucerasea]|uniref:major tail protein n=1 Tax=Blautia glucerasea TaxID=536633 RepID=UPI00156DA45B|nr:major tail protein [Blautia glucerasea]NSL04195.1 phage tail protein [Blautia glucerasea]